MMMTNQFVYLNFLLTPSCLSYEEEKHHDDERSKIINSLTTGASSQYGQKNKKGWLVVGSQRVVSR